MKCKAPFILWILAAPAATVAQDRVAIAPVVRQSTGGTGLNSSPTSLPSSDGLITPDTDFVVEIWAQQLIGVTGLSGVFVDAIFDDLWLDCLGRVPAPDWTALASGTCMPGLVDEVGGLTFSTGSGVAPAWVRIATINMHAHGPSETNYIDLSPATTPTAIVAGGTVPTGQIRYDSSPVFAIGYCLSAGDCDDGLYCNGAEECAGAVCLAGTPPTCDDLVGCTVDTCDVDLDACVYTPNDTLCDNGTFCDGAEFCDQALDCQAGVPPVVADGVACTVDFCDETNDVVVHVASNGLCDNGLYCDGDETCDAALDCQAGPPPALDDGVACTVDYCDEATDTIIHVASNGLCDNGLFCDGDEFCDELLDCQAGPPPSADDGIACTVDLCDEATDTILHVASNGLCDNGLYCDGDEFCDELLDCQAGTPPVADDGIACTIDSCDEVSDTIVNLTSNGLCDNGLFCDGTEVCDAALDCQPGLSLDLDDGVGCTIDSCDEINDVVVHVASNGLCDNGLFCDGDEFCDELLDCQVGTPPDLDDGVACTVDSCDEANDVILHVASNGLCDNGLFCDGTESCDELLDCQAGTPPDLDDGVACTVDSCDEANDVILHVASNGLCDNGLFCDGDEFCDELLDCQAGTPPDLDDGVACTVDSCDEVNDVILHVASNGLCDNGLFCDGAESCDELLDCQLGSPPGLDDGIGCTIDSCDESTDTIVHAASNGLCDNGQFCDGAEYCDASLDCQPGTPPDLDDGVPCTVDSCDEVNDVILHVASNGLCDNGLFCDGDEFCDELLDCQVGTPPNLDDGVVCTVDSCDEANDVILHVASNGLCDNGRFCDGGETCDPTLDCQPGAPPAVDDGIACTVDSCDEANDAILHVASNGLCDNGLYCDGAEFCDAALDCQPGSPPGLDDGIGCTIDSCDESTDTIVHAASNGLCDNGQFCDGAEYCDASLDCQPGTPPDLDDGVPCTVDSCDEVNDAILHVASNGLCDNGLFCDGTETCDATLGCQDGTPPSLDDGVPCTVDSCDDVNDVIVHVTSNGLCGNGQFCDGAETCDATLGCRPGTPPALDDGIACTMDSCDEANDAVVHAASNGLCDNGQYCDGSETCDATLACQAGTPPNLDDGISCTVDSCDEATDTIIHVASNGLCDNGIFCDGVETCDAILQCQAGVPPTCDDAISCTVDSCNPTTDACVHSPSNALCDNGMFCDGAEVCSAANDCQAGPLPCGTGTWCEETLDLCFGYGNGDFDLDNDVDLRDFATFSQCMGGTALGGCEIANLTGPDGAIDLEDYTMFSAELTGPQ